MTSSSSPWKAGASKHQYAQSSQLTFDHLLSALFKSFFHPFVACLLPLCLRALAAPYTSTSFILTSAYAGLVCFLHILALLNQKLAYGPPRKINWENEVVVITGGCGGLGGCIAEIYAMRGLSVAVMDVAFAQEQSGKEKEGVKYYFCDVASREQIQSTWKRIEQELGTPTILINNAAVVANGPIYQKNPTSPSVEQVFRINTLSHFYAVNVFLQHLENSKKSAGTIVTVASVLGHLGAANLGVYSASKAALLAYHASLSAELVLSAPSVKTILVAPGQLDTQLFSTLKVDGWLRKFLAPVVGAGELAMRIVEMNDRGEGGEIRLPAFARWVALMNLLPMSVQKWLRWWIGMDTAMGDVRKLDIDPSDDDKETEKYSDGESSEEN